jgi:hypothetical protein
MDENQNKPKGKYRVGKGRPPTETQWKCGQSGNPSGRPKGSRNFATIFGEILNRTRTVLRNGKRSPISTREFIAEVVVQKAAGGDLNAYRELRSMEPEIAREQRTIKLITLDMSAEEASALYAESLKQPFTY